MTPSIRNTRNQLKNDGEHNGFSQAELGYQDLLFKVMFCIEHQHVDGGVTFVNDELNGTVPMNEIIDRYQEWKEKGNASGMVQTQRTRQDSNERDDPLRGVGCVR